MIEQAKSSAQNIMPVISNHGHSQIVATSPSTQRSAINGDITISMNLDGKTIGYVSYPTWKAIRSHEMSINGAHGAIPVGNARPLGGVY